MGKLINNDNLSKDELKKIDAYFRATNFLSASQLYLKDNPLLTRPLERSDVKNRIVGPWGTAPGQNFIYVHLNRVIKKFDLNMILLSGPGHGGHFWTANTYLEGTWSEFYPEVTEDMAGLQKFDKQFCFPFGVSSHVAPEMPGSIHEGGELGYVLGHAYGAVLDNPDLIATAIVGDGEAETGPLATSWHANKFLNPITDGAVLPILHLNGFKVFNPTVLARISHEELKNLFEGYGYEPYFVEGDEPMKMHTLMAKTMCTVIRKIKQIQERARKNNDASRPKWPMIILRTPKGWTCPKVIDGKSIEGTHNAYHAPFDMTKETHLKELESWLKSYKPEELFDKNGSLKKELKDLAPKGQARMGSNPIANGGLVLRELNLPNLDKYGVKIIGRGQVFSSDTTVLGGYMRDIIKANPDNFRIFSPDEMVSNRMKPVYEVTNNVFNAEIFDYDESIAKSGRVMDSYLSEHTCEGWLEGYLLTGRHGTFSCYAAFIRVVDSMISQHSKWIKMSKEVTWRKPIASLNLVLTSHAWQQEHNGYSHQDPGLLDHLANKKEDIIRLYLPPDSNCLLSCYNHCMQTKNYINAIVTSKHPSPQWLTLEEANAHCEQGLGIWNWASNGQSKPDVIIACAGDIITMETVASAQILKENLPNLKFRFINVVDLMKLTSDKSHPHGLSDREFDKYFTKDKPIIFNFHGYRSLIHELTWNRHNRDITVCGYQEEGRISTPFDMRVQNKVDRFNFVKEVLRHIPKTDETKALDKKMDAMLKYHNEYIKENGIDIPEVLNFKFNLK